MKASLARKHRCTAGEKVEVRVERVIGNQR
jgi:hypothetical protein